MAAQRYRFIGQVTTGFYAYVDLDTGSMLTAQPGQGYAIAPTEEGLPVPPSETQWEPAPVRQAKTAKNSGGEASKSAEGGES